MDYIYCSALKHFSEIELMTMYDIVCQWALYLEKWVSEMPEELRMEVAKFSELRYAIGKLHWHGHKKEDHSQFSLNYLRRSSRTNGEGIERRWWNVQPIANSTKMMGPGGRKAALNDIWGFANWVKTLGLCEYCFDMSQHITYHLVASDLCRKFVTAIHEAKEQQEEYDAFSKSFSPVTLAAWEKMVSDWEQNHENHPDSYVYAQDSKLSVINAARPSLRHPL